MFKTDLLIGGKAIEAADRFDRINPLTGDVATRAAAATVVILARVFRHGAAMREDLEGTV